MPLWHFCDSITVWAYKWSYSHVLLTLKKSLQYKQVMRLPSPRPEAHVCLPVRGATLWVLLEHCSMSRRLVFIVEWSRAFSVLYGVWSSGIILIPRLPLCQISFFRSLHCWASLWRKISYSSHFNALRTKVLALQNIKSASFDHTVAVTLQYGNSQI